MQNETKTNETKASVVPEGVNSKEKVSLAAQQKNRMVAYAELLEGRPYTMMADDLAVTYHVNLSENGEGLMSTAVTNALADTYGLDAEGLHEIAMKNMPVVHVMQIILTSSTWKQEIFYIDKISDKVYHSKRF